MKKGIRVFWDKQNLTLSSECYDPIAEAFTTSEHIKANLKLDAESNLHRIPNEYIIDFREKLIKDNFKKIETKYYDFFQGFKCNVFDK